MKIIVDEPQIHKRICKEMLEVKAKYLPLLCNKLRLNYDNKCAERQAHIINDAIRKIAINSTGKHRIETMNNEDIELATIIMEDIYFYLINGHAPKKRRLHNARL